MALLDRIRNRPGSKRPPDEAVAHSGNGDGASSEPPSGSQAEWRRRGEHRRKRERQYQELKSRVHRELFDHIDFSKLGEVSESRASSDIAGLTRRILDEQDALFNADERERFVSEIQDEVFGLGPLEPLLKDPEICDILVNRHDQIYIERQGCLELTGVRFLDDAHLMRIIERILNQVGRRVDESTPMVDARLRDGSRVNVIVPPLALDGPVLSIRRFSEEPLTAERLIELGSITLDVVALLEACVEARLNIVISGGTGSGKTTMLNMLSCFVPETERIVSIEDSAELQLNQEHVVRLETRPPNIEGRGQVSQRELVINSLRMRPDRILVGEVRGAEALDMLQAMNTGHDGSLTTIHANSPADAIMRLETMVAMSGFDLPVSTTRAQIGSAIDLVIQVKRFANGTRAITSVQEITGLESGAVAMQELFALTQEGPTGDGDLHGVLASTGVQPTFLGRLAACGVGLPEALFVPESAANSPEPEKSAS
jgi:pilus assembly protein CpaF